MRINFGLIGLACLLPHWLSAKQPKLYRCVQSDGTVVIQDRRCEVTRLQQSQRPSTTFQKAQKHKPKPKSSSAHLNQTRRAQSTPKTRSKPQPRSLRSISQLQIALPRGWEQVNGPGQVHFKPPGNNIERGIRLQIFHNTQERMGRGAFAQALQLYHQIRDNGRLKLRDSGFKSHTRFKVFNIEYWSVQGLQAITEFYVDEVNDDLYVLKVVANPAEWNQYWRLAEQLVAQL